MDVQYTRTVRADTCAGRHNQWRKTVGEKYALSVISPSSLEASSNAARPVRSQSSASLRLRTHLLKERDDEKTDNCDARMSTGNQCEIDNFGFVCVTSRENQTTVETDLKETTQFWPPVTSTCPSCDSVKAYSFSPTSALAMSEPFTE